MSEERKGLWERLKRKELKNDEKGRGEKGKGNVLQPP